MNKNKDTPRILLFFFYYFQLASPKKQSNHSCVCFVLVTGVLVTAEMNIIQQQQQHWACWCFFFLNLYTCQTEILIMHSL